MSRSGYSDDCDDDLALGRWRAQVASSIRGKRGQAFLRDLIAALDAMPEKRLIPHELIKRNEVEKAEFCALGVIGQAKGIDMTDIDPYDHETLSEKLNITTQLVQEVEYLNDETYSSCPEERWKQMRDWAVRHLKESLAEMGKDK